MSLDRIKTNLLAKHSGKPQNQAFIDLAFRQIAEGLSLLAKHGHVFFLAEGSPEPESIENSWPRTIFHLDIAPGGRVVNSPWHLQDLGGKKEGWFYTLEEAQLAAGIKTQFAGRGGVGSRNVPVLVVDNRGKKND